MAQNPFYSTLFSCLYDEQEPIGYLGRGAHYSIFRSVEWLDVERRQLEKPQIHDFAVIWDEDHDTRIIDVIERIYMAGFLSPVQFIGERKGMLSIVLAARYYRGSSDDFRGAQFEQLVESLADVDGDTWSVELGCFDRHDMSARGHQTELPGIIQSDDEVVFTYLKNIDNLWRLGTKNWHPEATRAAFDAPPLGPLSFSESGTSI